METVTYGDYITTRGLYNLAELCTYAEINPKKLYLYQLIETYLYDIDMFNEMMEFDKSTGNEEDKASIITNKKLMNLD